MTDYTHPSPNELDPIDPDFASGLQKALGEAVDKKILEERAAAQERGDVTMELHVPPRVMNWLERIHGLGIYGSTMRETLAIVVGRGIESIIEFSFVQEERYVDPDVMAKITEQKLKGVRFGKPRYDIASDDADGGAPGLGD